jgi:hypothetical protein
MLSEHTAEVHQLGFDSCTRASEEIHAPNTSRQIHPPRTTVSRPYYMAGAIAVVRLSPGDSVSLFLKQTQLHKPRWIAMFTAPISLTPTPIGCLTLAVLVYPIPEFLD